VVQSVFGRGSCEKLIKYNARKVTFTGLSIGAVKAVTVDLGSVSTEVKVLQKASEIAQTLDNYQYMMCALLKSLDKKDKDYKDFVRMRAAAITLITAFQMTLTASGIDERKFEEQFKELISRMQRLADDIKPDKTPGHVIIESYQHPIGARKTKVHIREFKSAESMVSVDRAFKYVGVREVELSKFLKKETE